MNNNNLVSTKCALCGHRNVCSLKKDLESFCQNLILGLSDDEIANANENFSVEAKCKHFVDSVTVNPFYVVTPAPFDKGIVAPNPCDECPTGKRLQSGDYIGVIPCEYCKHNPGTITCNSTNA